MSTTREKALATVRKIQDQVCSALGEVETTPFIEDQWTRPEGGGGWTRVLQDGKAFEKAGVAVSEVHGVLPKQAILSMLGGKLKPEDFDTEEERTFFATGVSSVIHPHHPMAPTMHFNFRYFEIGPEGPKRKWWFGGGADLTPSYLFEEDAVHFHQTLKDACDAHDPAYFPRFKTWCDEYFWNKHRGEARGVGGIFFDGLNDRDPDELLAFIAQAGASIGPSYVPILKRRVEGPFTDDQKRWQAMRRGRYVEFNLVYDRGTTFGLKTGGRVESILMSMPLSARWEYNHTPETNSEEAKILEVLTKPRAWV